jgi:hypothetical protein
MPMPAEVIMPASVFGLSMRETRLWNEGYNAALADVRQRLLGPATAENPNDAGGDPRGA